jgi:hypothetical protein
MRVWRIGLLLSAHKAILFLFLLELGNNERKAVNVRQAMKLETYSGLNEAFMLSAFSL